MMMIVDILKVFADIQHLLLLAGLVFAWRWFQRFWREKAEEDSVSREKLHREIGEVIDGKLKNGLREMVVKVVNDALSIHEDKETINLKKALQEVQAAIQEEGTRECRQTLEAIQHHDKRLTELEDHIDRIISRQRSRR